MDRQREFLSVDVLGYERPHARAEPNGEFVNRGLSVFLHVRHWVGAPGRGAPAPVERPFSRLCRVCLNAITNTHGIPMTDSESIFVKIGGALGRSRGGQLFVALVIGACFSGIAYAVWRVGEWFGTALTVELLIGGLRFALMIGTAVVVMQLLVYGFTLAWRIFPISVATRDRWVRKRAVVAQCRACQYRRWSLIGSVAAVAAFLHSISTKPSDYSLLVVLGILSIAWCISHVICQRFLRSKLHA